MTFDMGRAWNDAVAMIRMNKDVVSVLAGMFLFLPFLALLILLPQPAGLEAAAGDQEKLQTLVNAFLLENWIAFLLFSLVFLVGSLSLTSLLGRRNDPTVANAIKSGVVALVPFAACMALLYGFEFILSGIAEQIFGRLDIAIINLVLAVLLLAIVIVVRVRLMMTGPIMAIEQSINPLTAMQRSWTLVTGSTRQIFAFLILIGIASAVIGVILLIIISILAALAGGGVASMWIEAIFSSMLVSAIIVVIVAVFAAIHRQLTRKPPEQSDQEPSHLRFRD